MKPCLSWYTYVAKNTREKFPPAERIVHIHIHKIKYKILKQTLQPMCVLCVCVCVCVCVFCLFVFFGGWGVWGTYHIHVCARRISSLFQLVEKSILVRVFIYIRTLCVRAKKGLVSLLICVQTHLSLRCSPMVAHNFGFSLLHWSD